MRVAYFVVVLVGLSNLPTRLCAQNEASNAALFSILQETLAGGASESALQAACTELGYDLNRAYLFVHQDLGRVRAWLADKRASLPFSRFAVSRHGAEFAAVVLSLGADLVVREEGAGSETLLRFAVDPGITTPRLYVLLRDGRVELQSVNVDAQTSRSVLAVLGADVVRVQLVAETAHGTLPIATYSLPGRTATSEDGEDSIDARLASIRQQARPARRVRGAVDLRRNALLVDLAEARAREVCARNQATHETAMGSPQEFLEAHSLVARAVGEVLGIGATRREVWQQLFASPSHRFALQQHRFTDIGIGETVHGPRMCVVVLMAERPRVAAR